MTTHLVVDAAAVRQLTGEPEIRRAMLKLGNDVLADSQQNLHAMDAVDSGDLLRSGFVDQDSDGTTRVGFTVVYAPIVHEGYGTSTSKGPRPFLSAAATRNRGRLT